MKRCVLSLVFSAVFSFAVCFFTSSAFGEFKGLTAVSAGATYPTALGYTYQALDRSLPGGVQVDVWADGSWIADSFLLHGGVAYEPLFVRNLNTVDINATFGFVGLQIQKGDYLSGLSFFFSIDVGVMYDWMSFSGVTTSTADSAVSFANQVVPGFDLPLYGRFGIIGEMPIKLIYLRSAIVLFDPSISVRFKL
jgi:hypothetical protein